MTKYTIDLVACGLYTASWTVEVEANNKEEAILKAWDITPPKEDVYYDYERQDKDALSVKEIN